ncbi:hypothetical protein [Aquibacillus koreensis]|uniref:hypothetical protein n=1 Tax=Aquibacillus koreensis TaxID=279446 RepID=UPI0023422403|nr:hypothetical protein [Aquibacillus koreensis]
MLPYYKRIEWHGEQELHAFLVGLDYTTKQFRRKGILPYFLMQILQVEKNLKIYQC